VFQRKAESVQLTKNLNPSNRPRGIGFLVDVAERAKGKVRLRPGQIVEFTAGRLSKHPNGIAPIERENLRSGIAEPLRRNQTEGSRFASTRGPHDECVAEIRNVQVESERRRTTGCGVKESPLRTSSKAAVSL
jgi:hypothetical protein